MDFDTPTGEPVKGEPEGYEKGVFYQTACETLCGLKNFSEAFQNPIDTLAHFLETMCIQKIRRHGLTTHNSQYIITNVSTWSFLDFDTPVGGSVKDENSWILHDFGQFFTFKNCQLQTVVENFLDIFKGNRKWICPLPRIDLQDAKKIRCISLLKHFLQLAA